MANLWGTAGNDTLSGGSEDNIIGGGAGDDRLIGNSGRDQLMGGDGSDTLIGAGGNNWMQGGAGSDRFVLAPGGGWDYIDDFQAGAGGDVLDLTGYADITSFDALLAKATSDGSDTVITFAPTASVRLAGVSLSSLTAANVRLAQGTEPGTPPGGEPSVPPPSNTITGTAGADYLAGTAGADLFLSGAGNDYMVGGAGSDHFVVKPGDGWDYIADFQVGSGGDVLDLSAFAGIQGMGDLTFSSDATGTSVIYGGNDGMRLEGVAAGTLTAANFRFANAGTDGGAPTVGSVSWASAPVDASAVTRVGEADTAMTSFGRVTNPANVFGGASGLSADGRYMVFASSDSTLVGGDTNGVSDIFLKDLQTGTVTRVSTDSNGNQLADRNTQAIISADGRTVAFINTHTDVTPSSTTFVDTVAVKDLETGALSFVTAGRNRDIGIALSADGNALAYQSRFDAFAGGGYKGPGASLVYADLDAGTTTVRQSDGGSPLNAYSADMSAPKISADGRYVGVFDPMLGLRRIDTQTGAGETLLSNAGGTVLGFSADGNSILFSSTQALTAGDTNSAADLFTIDIATKQVTRVSTGANGEQANGASTEGVLTADGQTLVFSSLASNLVSGDTNGKTDIFAKDLVTGAVRRVSVAADGTQSDGNSLRPLVSADGSRIVYTSDAGSLVAGDPGSDSDIFAVDTAKLADNGQPGTAGAVTLTLGFASGAAAVDQATVSWGDGQSGTQTVASGDSSVTVAHRYGGTGSFAGSVTLHDQGGGTTVTPFAVQIAGAASAGQALTGTDGLDVLYGNALGDTLSGAGGADHLWGGAGQDLLDGGAGDDLLIGGAGNDTLTGGIGADVFSFGPGSGQDIVTDFNVLGDRIQLTLGQDWSVGSDAGGNAVVSFTSDDRVTLLGVQASQINASLFIA